MTIKPPIKNPVSFIIAVLQCSDCFLHVSAPEDTSANRTRSELKHLICCWFDRRVLESWWQWRDVFAGHSRCASRVWTIRRWSGWPPELSTPSLSLLSLRSAAVVGLRPAGDKQMTPFIQFNGPIWCSNQKQECCLISNLVLINTVKILFLIDSPQKRQFEIWEKEK